MNNDLGCGCYLIVLGVIFSILGYQFFGIAAGGLLVIGFILFILGI